MTKETEIAINDLETHKKLVTTTPFIIEAEVKFKEIVTWDLNLSFTKDEIKEMLLEAIDKKMIQLGKEINDFVLDQDTSDDFINGQIITQDAVDEVEWGIRDREDFVEELKYTWIPEAKAAGRSDVVLMEQDLAYLEKYEDKYILSSESTNAYLIQSEFKDKDKFKEVCEDLIRLSTEQK